ncbi:unnamed protein product [Lactuca saligna]|uniref:Uncharacterized protein n=1 Tax=Lactuca saligna TaxID=75948 RepID=A0AA36DYM0_LACSI|nr:unnamed protein product [Lactuca saligna]
MTRRVEAEVDPQKQIVDADILDVDATMDQPIPDTGDHLETHDYEGLLDLGFMQQAVVLAVPLNVVYAGYYFEVEISQEGVKLAIQQLLNKVKKLNLVPSAGPSRPSSSGRTSAPRQSNNTKFLIPYGTWYINNELPVGVEPVQYLLISETGAYDILS